MEHLYSMTAQAVLSWVPPDAMQAFGHALSATRTAASMSIKKLLLAVFCASIAFKCQGTDASRKELSAANEQYGAPLQDIVTWDANSISIRGERLMLLNGEIHPFRLPVPGLWLDIFQKLKSAGFTAVSFYVDWFLLEGKEGEFRAEGIFDLNPFFDAAKEAGIYLLARPGPYINAEVAGGGFPGWLARYKATGRTSDFLNLTANYVKNIGSIIAKAQITNGGPVILLQPENEYTYSTADQQPFPNRAYFQAVQDQYRAIGLTVPFFSNDAAQFGYLAPGTGNGTGNVDIYGHDAYPLGFNCANPYTWPDNSLPKDFLANHRRQSPNTPYFIAEFQGGSFDPWGGPGFSNCAALLGPEFERVFYKNNYAAGIDMFTLYMVFGGTNWGNLGHPGGYTSYDYGAIIAEDRTVSREKYSELKLQANFLKVSPAYLTTNATYTVNGSWVDNPEIATARLGNSTQGTQFFITRHSAFNSLETTDYKLQIPTSAGNISIPQLSGTLSLHGRDSKIHVADYKIGKYNVLYSSAEVFTWKDFGDKTILVLYGGPGEIHEAAFTDQETPTIVEGAVVKFDKKFGALIVNWNVSTTRIILKFPSGLYVHLLDRSLAYNYWTLDLPQPEPTGLYARQPPALESLIVNGGYLLRNASIAGDTIDITGDLNATTTIEVVGGAPANARLIFNGQPVDTKQDDNGILRGTVNYIKPDLKLPNLSKLSWKFLDSLPEIKSDYSADKWLKADRATTLNSVQRPPLPPDQPSLFNTDYNFTTGNLISRAHFMATGTETYFTVSTQGGLAYAASIWLNNTLIEAFAGQATEAARISNITLPTLQIGSEYVITILTDNMGQEQDFVVGYDTHKNPRGVMNYTLSSRKAKDIFWRITGNLGGQDYADKARGPLNEGGLYAERQGYHLPKPPTENWETRSPFEGITTPGVGFYTAHFDLDIPVGYDTPLAFVFTNITTNPNFRVQLYVNGYQFGKYVNNIGPQTSFPVPEGILNHHGTNYIAISLWGFDSGGNKLGGLELQANAVIQSGYGSIRPSPQPPWSLRPNAY